MRVLVTGGTGYLGRAVVRHLAERGHTPVVFARRASTVPQAGEKVDGDIQDAEGVRVAARDCDAVVHTAALVSIWRADPSEFDKVNVGGLQHVINLVVEQRVARLVYTSSFLALPPQGRTTPLQANDYQRTKVAALTTARAAMAAGHPVVCLSPGVIYGPGVRTEGNLIGRMLADYLAGRLPGLIGADHIWSYAYLDDVARAHVTAVERGRSGAHYDLGGENVPQIRVFEVAARLRARRLPRRIPYAIADAMALVEELRVRALGGQPLLTRGAVEIFRHDWPVTSQAAEQELDYHSVPLEQGVEQTLSELD